MKIILDAFGGDNAPEEIVAGGVAALEQAENFTLVFTGKKDKIEEILDRTCKKELRSRIEIVDCDEVITNDDVPTVAVRKKANSSLVKGIDLLKESGEQCAFVSAGSTGAVLTAAIFRLGRIEGISRPSLAPVLPSMKGGNIILIDCGANADCKPINLVHFAIMGSCYMKAMYGMESPRVALLSNGTEDHKGNKLTKDTFEILKNIKEINFVGNTEGRDVLTGENDVIVCDGFSGNVCLKSLEGMSMAMMSIIKSGIKQSFKAKLGALLMKDVFKTVKSKLDYNSNGGAIFLGVNGVVVKAHGAAKTSTIKNAVLQAIAAVEGGVVGKIKGLLKDVDLDGISGEAL